MLSDHAGNQKYLYLIGIFTPEGENEKPAISEKGKMRYCLNMGFIFRQSFLESIDSIVLCCSHEK